jgi:hypothetical protein
MVQVPLGGTAASVQVDAAEKSDPLNIEISYTTSGASPAFVTSTDRVSPFPARGTPCQVSVAGVTLITGAIPLPESATIEGLPAASLAMLKLALLAPRLVGLKVRVIVQLPPTGTVVQPLLPIAY